MGKHVIRALSLLNIGIFLSLLAPVPSRAQLVPQTRGVFAVVPPSSSSTINSAILTDPDLKGIFAMDAWSDIEGQEGVYDWTFFDSVLSQATANNKQVILGVGAGYQTPSWVYTDGAASFNFLWDLNSTQPATCSVQTTPIPWDPVFLAKWQAFVLAMGAHYSSNPAVISVMLYGVNFHSIETSLPGTNGQAISGGGQSCTGYNYPALWQAAGYTRTRLENTLFTLQGYYVNAFPRTQLLAGLTPGGFPPIDENGNLIAGQTSDTQVPADLVANGSLTLGPQFSAGDGGLGTNGWTWSMLTQYASTVNTGYQTVNALGTNLPTAITLALTAGSRWLQLYQSDITLSSNQAAIASAAQALN